jgi:protein-disulfide isomerase
VVFGKPEAPITIVEYSDFQCPFCARGAQRIKQLKEKYGEKVRVVYKHLPIRSEHPHAQITAQYFEAVGLQDPVKAEKFHDLIFENQDKLINGGEEYLKTVIKDIGVSYSKIQLDLNSEVVLERIKADEAEAEAFGLSSTPSFLINGVTLKGAAPIEEFILIIDQLKLNL